MIKKSKRHAPICEGDVLGKLTVLKKDLPGTKRCQQTRWFVRCACGKKFSVLQYNLRPNAKSKTGQQSCGGKGDCTKRYKHGHGGKRGERTAMYNAWDSMVQRCTNPNSKFYSYYGGRGIEVCRKWLQFEAFLDDMGERSGKKLTLDRIDNSRGYSKENCRWATRSEQQNNRRCCVRITAFGKSLSISEWSKKLKINPTTIRVRRFRGMTSEQCLSVSFHKSGKGSARYRAFKS